MGNNTLSVIILSRPDELLVERAIVSVLWADEVLVVVDSEPQEKVLVENIVDKYEVVMIRRKLLNDFSEQRNYALSQVKGDWVLFLDADEYIDASFKTEFQRKSANYSHESYRVKRKDMFFDKQMKHGEMGTISLVRLGKKSKGSWQRPVHEVWEFTQPSKSFSSYIWHTPHQSLSSFLNKINRYTTLEAEYRKSQGEVFSLIKLMVYPLGKFVVNYLFKLGFLDGIEGFMVAYFMSLHSLIVRVKMYEG